MNNSTPESCPGTDSTEAGKASACQGCPNQKICASATPAPPDPDIDLIAANLCEVKKKVLVLSGKGGVGKSTVTGNIAKYLSSKELDVGVLDVDLCGPSGPRLFGVEGEQVHKSGSGLSPVFVDDHLSVMSSGFLLPTLESAVIWRGPKKNALIKQMLKDVNWGALDYLLIDTPPGTSDEHLSLIQYLSKSEIDGCIIVTTPQNVSLNDVKKEIDFCQKVNLKIIGLIENMSGFSCPKCSVTSDILPRTSGGAISLCEKYGIPLLGKIPLDPRIARACDEGTNVFEDETLNETQFVIAYDNIIKQFKNFLNV